MGRMKEAVMVGQTHEQPTPLNTDEIEEFSKQVMKAEGKLIPQFFVEAKKQDKYLIDSVLLLFKTDDEKQATLKALRGLIEKRESNRCVVIFEAWTSTITPGELPYIRASRSITRRECIVISEFNKDTQSKSILIPFDRKDEKDITFKDPEKVNQFETFWNPFTDFDEMVKKQDVHNKEITEMFIKKQAESLANKFGEKLKQAKTEEDKQKLMEEIMIEMEEVEKKVNRSHYEEVEEDDEEVEDGD